MTALDELADAAADGGVSVAALAAVVRVLEQAAGAPLGGTDGEPLVVLQRRFGRAVRRLPVGALSTREVLDLLAQLQCTVPAQRISAPAVSIDPVLVRS